MKLKSQLKHRLNQVTATQESRQQVAAEIKSSPVLIGFLLEIMFENQDTTGIHAAWVLEWICRSNLTAIENHLSYFCDHLHQLSEDGSIRTAAKMCEQFALNRFKTPPAVPILSWSQREQLITVCFDWLIGKTTTATKAYSMQALYYLGDSNSWIHQELKAILIREYPAGSAGYQARARKVLKLLE